MGVLVLPMRVGDPVVGLRRRNRLAVGYPPYVCQNVLAFRSNFFGAITHRGGRDARVPVRRRFAAIVGCADIGRFGEPIRFPPPLSACADATAWQSVAHPTISNTLSATADFVLKTFLCFPQLRISPKRLFYVFRNCGFDSEN
jgi:hypothetical protein